MFKKRVIMLNIGQFLYTYKTDQHISDKVYKKLEDYFKSESKIFSRYSSLENSLYRNLPNINYQSEDDTLEFRKMILFLCSTLDEEMNSESKDTGSVSEITKMLLDYFDFISQSQHTDSISHIQDAIREYKNTYTYNYTYSYKNSYRLLQHKHISPEDLIYAMKCIYFAHDHFNFKYILLLRKYILTNFNNDNYIKLSLLKDNPGNDLLGIIFSDSVVLPDIFVLYEFMSTQFDVMKNNFSLLIDDKINVDNLMFILNVSYARYLVGICIFIIQCDYTGYFDKKNVEVMLLRMYRKFSFIIFTSIYKYFSVADMFLCISTLLLDDICIFTASMFTRDMIDNARSIASALSRDSAIEVYDDILDKICKEILKLWYDGNELGHIDMINKYKNSTKYLAYFEKKGFERQLREKLKNLCKERNIPRITGIHVSARKGKKRGH